MFSLHVPLFPLCYLAQSHRWMFYHPSLISRKTHSLLMFSIYSKAVPSSPHSKGILQFPMTWLLYPANTYRCTQQAGLEHQSKGTRAAGHNYCRSSRPLGCWEKRYCSPTLCHHAPKHLIQSSLQAPRFIPPSTPEPCTPRLSLSPNTHVVSDTLPITLFFPPSPPSLFPLTHLPEALRKEMSDQYSMTLSCPAQ